MVMAKKNEAVEVFVELLESKLDEGQLQKCDDKSSMFYDLIDKYDGWVVKEHFYLSDKGQLTFPLGVEQLKNTLEDKKRFDRSLKYDTMRFTITNIYTDKTNVIQFDRETFRLSPMSKEQLEQIVDNIKYILDSMGDGNSAFLYTVKGNNIHYVIATVASEKLVSNHNRAYDTMLERKKRADYALELLEIEDAIYRLSQKRKQVKAALERNNFSLTSSRNRFLK